MSIIQKSDRYTEALSKQMETVFGSKDIIDTMRFTELDGVEEFSNSMAFGNARSWLYTGISQLQREIEALKKYKEAGYKTPVTEEDTGLPKDAEYDPKIVDDLLEKWKLYDMSLNPENPKNLIVVLNYLWRYNRNLMWVVHVFFPIHLAVLNGRYARGSRTFKAFVSMAKNLYQRDDEVEIGGRQRSLRHPLGQSQKD